MNYLAHALLSFGQPEVLTGNMISDFVKGKKQFEFDAPILKGIKLHRSIDTFTDNHAQTKMAKQFFKPAVGLYAGAFTDVAFDHFLANDVHEFKNEAELLGFSLHVYATLEKQQPVFPEKFTRTFLYMKTENWLYNYKNISGIKKTFQGLAYRAKYLQTAELVFKSFENNYDALKHCYQLFFPELKNFAYTQFALLNTI